MHGVGGDEPAARIWKGSVDHLSKADPRMGAIIKSLGGKAPSIRAVHDPFEALVRAIAHQSVKAEIATKRIEKLKANFEGAFPRPAQILTLAPAKLRETGLSTNQANAILGLAKDVIAKKVDLVGLAKLGDAEVVEELQKLHGVGEWTAHMFLVFHLQREDVWMTGDVSLRNAVAKVFKMETVPTEAQMEGLSTLWKPYRSAAAWYIWSAGAGFSPGLH